MTAQRPTVERTAFTPDSRIWRGPATGADPEDTTPEKHDTPGGWPGVYWWG